MGGWMEALAVKVHKQREHILQCLIHFAQPSLHEGRLKCVYKCLSMAVSAA